MSSQFLYTMKGSVLMINNKTTRIEIRITEEEKQLLKNYVKENNTTISKLFRDFLQIIIKRGE